MERFKQWVKRPANFNFISVIAIAAVFIIMAVIVNLQLTSAEQTNLSGLKTDVNEILDQEEIDDVGGYGVIIGSLAYALGKGVIVFLYIFLVVIPLIISVVIVISAVILRSVYSAENRSRIIAYRVIAAFHYLFVILSISGYTYLFLGSREIAIIIPTVIVDIFMAAVIAVGIRNTYSNRILLYREEEHEKIKI